MIKDGGKIKRRMWDEKIMNGKKDGRKEKNEKNDEQK